MRTVTYGGAVTLDGFLAGVDGAIDWLHFSADVQQIVEDFWKGVDTILMGRKTYAVAAAQAPRKRTKSRTTTGSAQPRMQTYVFSRTLDRLDDPDAKLVSDAVPFVRQLKQQPGGNICLMGGGDLAQSLLGAGLVDEVGLNIHPIVLGSGIPAFRDPGHRVRLTLVETRPLDGGCILATYKVVSG